MTIAVNGSRDEYVIRSKSGRIVVRRAQVLNGEPVVILEVGREGGPPSSKLTFTPGTATAVGALLVELARTKT